MKTGRRNAERRTPNAERRTVGVAGIALSLACLCLLSGCATKEKVYQAPDASKVRASQQKLNVAVDKAEKTAKQAADKVAAAQKSADLVAASSIAILQQVNELLGLVPDELRPRVEILKTAVGAQQLEELELTSNLSAAHGHHAQLGAELVEAQLAKLQLQKDQGDYQSSAMQLASAATDERNYRIKAEKKLSWYRWHFWLSWIALAAGVVACFIFGLLKWTGKIAFKGAKAAL